MMALQIVRETARAHGLTVREIKAKGNKVRPFRARVDAAQRLAIELGFTGGQIARFLNRSDWTCRYYVNPWMRAWHKERNKQYAKRRKQ